MRVVEKIIVEVMLKPEILDPQGRAILGIFNRSGHAAIENVRQGKRFEISINQPITDELLDEIEELATEAKRLHLHSFLPNPDID